MCHPGCPMCIQSLAKRLHFVETRNKRAGRCRKRRPSQTSLPFAGFDAARLVRGCRQRLLLVMPGYSWLTVLRKGRYAIPIDVRHNLCSGFGAFIPTLTRSHTIAPGFETECDHWPTLGFHQDWGCQFEKKFFGTASENPLRSEVARHECLSRCP